MSQLIGYIFFLFGRFVCFHFIWKFTVSPRFLKNNRWKVSTRASTCSFSASGNSSGYENEIHSKAKDNLWPCSYWFQGSLLPLSLLFTNLFLVYFMFEISEPRSSVFSLLAFCHLYGQLVLFLFIVSKEFLLTPNAELLLFWYQTIALYSFLMIQFLFPSLTLDFCFVLFVTSSLNWPTNNVLKRVEKHINKTIYSECQE